MLDFPSVARTFPLCRVPRRSEKVSFVLRFPVVLNGGIVIRNAPLILRVVQTIGHVYEHRGRLADHLVAMSDPRRDQDLPWAQRTCVQRIFHAEGGRVRAQIHQRHLEHPLRRDPQIGLVLMEVKRLDGAGIAQRRGDLRGLGRKGGGQALAHADHLEKISAVIRPDVEAAQAHSVDEAGRIRQTDQGPDAVFAVRSGNAAGYRDRSAHGARLARTPAATLFMGGAINVCGRFRSKFLQPV
jgi:hypothetical protein